MLLQLNLLKLHLLMIYFIFLIDFLVFTTIGWDGPRGFLKMFECFL